MKNRVSMGQRAALEDILRPWQGQITGSSNPSGSGILGCNRRQEELYHAANNHCKAFTVDNGRDVEKTGNLDPAAEIKLSVESHLESEPRWVKVTAESTRAGEEGLWMASRRLQLGKSRSDLEKKE